MTIINPQMNSEIVSTQAAELVVYDPMPLDQHPAAVYLASLRSNRSRRTQGHALAMIADLINPGAFVEPERPKHPGRKATQAELDSYHAKRERYKAERAAYDSRFLAIDWGQMRYQHVAAIRARVGDLYAANTANRMLSALRGVLKNAYLLGHMPAEDYQRAAMIEGFTVQTLPTGRALDAGEIKALVEACESDASRAGYRDAALIATMYPGGLRRAEVAELDVSDYNPEDGALTVRHGKRNKARIVYMTNGAARAMADWLAERGLSEDPEALFWPVDKGGNLQPRRLTNQAVYNALAKRGQEAGVRGFSPHDLRRTFISDMLEAGADIAVVAKLAGHASVLTTARYDRRPEAAKKRAAGLLHLPYVGRQ